MRTSQIILPLYLNIKDMQFLVVIGMMVAVLAIALLGMAIRLVLVKDGEVRGGCAGKNPMMQEEGVACNMCGALPAEECKSEEA
tara:strand:+ start:150 stop:401 length:252 start_codon:yes stop_codon:yes gene_type:complete